MMRFLKSLPASVRVDGLVLIKFFIGMSSRGVTSLLVKSSCIRRKMIPLSVTVWRIALPDAVCW